MSHDALHRPHPDIVRRANVSGMDAHRDLCRRAEESPEEFWGELAEKEIFWYEKWSHVFEWNPPFFKWFAGARTNASYNCLDRHLAAGRAAKTAIIWEGEPGEVRHISYKELHRMVSRFASVLKSREHKEGDRAVLYMPMIPELPVAMLACARLGITHSVVFGGFSAEALKTRIQDLGATLLITADGGWRRAKEVRLKDAADEALNDCPTIREVIVCRRTGSPVRMKEGRDFWWHDLEEGASDDCPAVPLDSEHPLYVLYTSPTAIRALLRQGDQWPNSHDLSSLRLLGSDGGRPRPGPSSSRPPRAPSR